MALTNAQRQRAFRLRRKTQGHFKDEGTPMERLDVWVSADAAHGLRVLAELNDTSTQDELDRLIMAAVSEAKGRDRRAWSDASMGILERVTR